MHGQDQLARVREQYEGLLAEVREVAARVRARLDELRRQFPDDGSLMERPETDDSPAVCDGRRAARRVS